jgi:hypothetical protein
MPILGVIASSTRQGQGPVDTGSMFPIGAVTVGSAGAASITFSSIPSTYKHLQIRGYQKAASAGDLNFTLNGDTGANYTRHYLYGTGSSTASSGANTSQTLGYVGYNPSTVYFQASIIDILDYTSTVKYKTVRSSLGTDANGSGYILLTSSGWFATPAAITSITFTSGGGNFSQFSQFALYGIKGA